VDYLSRDDMAQVEHRLSRYLGLLRLQRSRAHVTVMAFEAAQGPERPVTSSPARMRSQP
jgi:hypothetical protein